MIIERNFCGLLSAGAIVLGAGSASAAVMTYDLAWQSQQSEGNSATAQLAMDDAVFDVNAVHPDNVSGCPESPIAGAAAPAPLLCVDIGSNFPGTGITAFDLSVDLNGETFEFARSVFGIFLMYDTRIDPTEEMVGQAGLRDFNFFSEQFPMELESEIELIGLSAMIAPGQNPPNGVAEKTFLFGGEQFVLTSFALADDMASVPLPASALMLLTAIGGFGVARARRTKA